ncbi:MAG: hypothetical protein IBX43_00335 [Campylobacterales bacterium]|nr:hypothetical protein [Campylobacterales bacterium]
MPNLSSINNAKNILCQESKGTGIGLYVSKMIIEDNTRRVLSVANHNKGAVFTISMKAKRDDSI